MVERNLRPLERLHWLTKLTGLNLRPPLRILGYRGSSPSICYSFLRLANLLFWRRVVLFFEFDDSVKTLACSRRMRFGTGLYILLLLFLLFLLLECWVKYCNAWTKVSWQFSGTGGDQVCLPVPTPTNVTSTGVKRPLA